MRANLTFFFSQKTPIFSKTAAPKDQNGSVVFYFGPSRELKWPYTGRTESPLRGHRLIGANMCIDLCKPKNALVFCSKISTISHSPFPLYPSFEILSPRLLSRWNHNYRTKPGARVTNSEM